MTIFNSIKSELKKNRDNIEEIVLDPTVFSKRYFRQLENKGFSVRWMNEDEQKELTVCFIKRTN